MARYEIIDEPHTKPWGERVIVDPTVILLAAIIVPLFWQPPMAGRYWIPPLWLIVNGYVLGSSTLGREIGTLVVGAIGWLSLFYGTLYLLNTRWLPITNHDVIPYLSILLFGTFFLTLYVAVAHQAQSYALFQYIRGDDE